MMSGCTGYQSYKEAKYSGFLQDYPEFQEGKEGVDKVWIKPGVDWQKYNKIMMDEVTFYMAKDSEYKWLTERH